MADGDSNDSWFYIDLSGVEQGPHPLAHMRHCASIPYRTVSTTAVNWAYPGVRECLLFTGVEHGLVPVDTKVKPSRTAPFEAACSYPAITTGIIIPAVAATKGKATPVAGAATEAVDRTEPPVTKRRARRAARNLPSKRAPGASPRKLRPRPTSLLSVESGEKSVDEPTESPAATPTGENASGDSNSSSPATPSSSSSSSSSGSSSSSSSSSGSSRSGLLLPAIAICALAVGVSAYWAWKTNATDSDAAGE